MSKQGNKSQHFSHQRKEVTKIRPTGMDPKIFEIFDVLQDIFFLLGQYVRLYTSQLVIYSAKT
jgi:hypothetical protein